MVVTHANLNKSVFVSVQKYATFDNVYSIDLKEYSKYYYTTTLSSECEIVIPLAAIVHKCDVIELGDKLIWFH